MKKILLYGVLILGICLVVLISAPFFIDLNKYKDSVLAQLKPYTDRIVDFETIDLTIVSGLGIEISGLQVMDSPAFSPEAFVHVDALDIKIRILPLIKKQIIAKKIIIHQPTVRIMRNAQGVFNFSDLVKIKKDDSIKPQHASQASPASLSSKSAVKPGWLAAALAHSVFIDQARILYKDEKLLPKAPAITLDALDLKLRDVSIEHPISIELAANLL
ncbi:MAG: AsmA family protein, partial [Deltaproteobacteria bacterium]|nr:AsmA family protein [Deltaproteobacteria bacterium]